MQTQLPTCQHVRPLQRWCRARAIGASALSVCWHCRLSGHRVVKGRVFVLRSRFCPSWGQKENQAGCRIRPLGPTHHVCAVLGLMIPWRTDAQGFGVWSEVISLAWYLDIKINTSEFMNSELQGSDWQVPVIFGLTETGKAWQQTGGLTKQGFLCLLVWLSNRGTIPKKRQHKMEEKEKHKMEERTKLWAVELQS